MKKYACMAALAAAFMLGGCSDNADSPGNPEPGTTPATEWKGQKPLKEIAAKNVGKANGFAIDLFRSIFKSQGNNVCISPTSVMAVFAMMANGDDGATRDEILEILGYDKGENGLADLNTYCNALMAEAVSTEGVTRCEFTNSIWHDPTLPIMTQFASDIENIFDGTLFPIWLGDQAGMNAVNEFVNEHTYGMIPELLTEPMNVRLAVLNTTYFKGTWENEFDKKYTRDAIFHNADGTDSETPFMWMHTDMTYCSHGNMRGVVLPYGGDRYTMTVIQPSDGIDLDTMLAGLNPTTLSELHKSARNTEVVLNFPKFETEINIEIDQSLREMGFQKVYSPGINKASDHYLHLVKVIHAVKIIVDEEGTEAAAATIAANTDSVPDYEIMTFTRPFVYLIKDNISDTILFMGAITSF
ncbi:MAG: hypothetical protein K2H72_00620 [Muribaculaceae bacterium]|nr:hypothetical protein [Muribaculaceae bacterium]